MPGLPTIAARPRLFSACARVPLLLGLLVAATPACRHAPPDENPDGAVKLFLEDMEAASDDPRVMKRAYDLLGPAARANLEQRAHHASQLQGRQVTPWEMLASGRFGLSFRPKPAMRYTIVSDRATVEVVGADPVNEHASVVCVHEAGGWRIEPGLPEP